MPSNRLIRRSARLLRDAATRANLRAELLPRLPFVIALVVSAVALVAAVEHRPKADAAVTVVDELPSGPPTYTDDAEFYGEEVELEILEYGFSRITDASGEEWTLVAVIVRNPYDGELIPGGLSIQSETERGYPLVLDQMYIGSIPPRSTAAVGYVSAVEMQEIPLEDLSLATADPSILYPEEAWETDEDSMAIPMEPLPQFTLAGTEPLASPDGYRVHFVSAAPEVTDVQISVLFRDGDGRLIGGLPVDSDPFGYDAGASAFRTLPAGESDQHFDLLEPWIPEEADLDRIEVGPSRY
jgi:hypothetical protein